MKTENSRRVFFKKCFSAGITLTGAVIFFAGCHSPENKSGDKNTTAPDTADACGESGLSAGDLKARQALGFVKNSPEKNKHCGNCKLYLTPAPGKECSKCQLFKGTVPSTAYCTYWAAQV